MISCLEEAHKPLKDHQAKNVLTLKHFEMSTATLREIERQLGDNLMPSTEPPSSLWGIRIVFNESLPLNAVKAVYK